MISEVRDEGEILKEERRAKSPPEIKMKRKKRRRRNRKEIKIKKMNERKN